MQPSTLALSVIGFIEGEVNVEFAGVDLYIGASGVCSVDDDELGEALAFHEVDYLLISDFFFGVFGHSLVVAIAEEGQVMGDGVICEYGELLVEVVDFLFVDPLFESAEGALD